jgi:hypothetical protein
MRATAWYGAAAPVTDDVGVRLEDRDDLLRRRHGLAVEHPAASLVEHLRCELDVVLERVTQLAELGLFERLRRELLLEFLDGDLRRGDRVFCDLDEILVQRQALLGLGCMLDRHRAALGSLVMVGEFDRDVLAGLAEQPRQHTNAVDQQARIRGRVDRGFDDGRVAAQALAIFDPLLLRVVNEHSIHALQCLGPHALEIALQRRLAWRLVSKADKTERAVALRVGEMEREVFVAEPV